jgi:hypothetical protein
MFLKEIRRMHATRQPAHRLIRQIDTGLYLSPGGAWVRDEHDAFDFPDLRSALITCERMQGTRVEMVLIFVPDRMPGPAPLTAA